MNASEKIKKFVKQIKDNKIFTGEKLERLERHEELTLRFAQHEFDIYDSVILNSIEENTKALLLSIFADFIFDNYTLIPKDKK